VEVEEKAFEGRCKVGNGSVGQETQSRVGGDKEFALLSQPYD